MHKSSQMTKKILAVIIGYAVFVILSLAFFRLTGINAKVAPLYKVMMLTSVFGTFTSLLAGFITQYIAKSKDLKVTLILALLMASFATFSYFKSSGSHWTQILAIFVFAPASIVGGLLYIKRFSKRKS